MQFTTAITKTTTVCRDPGPGLLVLWSSILLGMKQTFDDGMSSSAVWAVRHKKIIRGQRRVPGQISTEMTKRLPPLQHPLKRGAVSHPRRLVGIDVVMIATILFCSGWQASIMPTKPLQSHDLVAPLQRQGSLEVRQVKEPPSTISRDKQLRLDAAAAVADPLWSWAPLHGGLGHDVPVLMTARRKNCTGPSICTASVPT